MRKIIYFRIGAYDTVKSFYQEATGITGGAGLMAVRVAAGRTIAGLMAVTVAAGRTIL